MKRDIPMPTESRSNNADGWIACDDGLHLIQMDKNLSHYGWVFRKVDGGLPYSVREATSHEMAHAQARQHLRIGVAQIAGQAPAPQPHAEPIAWMVGTAFWWTKETAERDAAATGLPIVGLGPMTCSTEVEQLREVIKHSDAQLMRQSMRISNQRAQLAEAQALLREADEFMYIMTAHDGHAKLAHRYGKDWWDAIDKLRGKVCTALSASAKPSAPGKQGSSIRAVRAPEIQDLLDRAATAIGQYGDSLLGRGKREDSIDLLDLEREVRDLEQEFKGAFGQPCTQENICTSKL